MSWWPAVLGLGAAVVVNEFSDLSPWAADKVVTWAARLRYPDRPDRVTELRDLIRDRPGKVVKLATACGFLGAAAVYLAFCRVRAVSRRPADSRSGSAWRPLTGVAAAAVVLAIAFTGAGMAARAAQPGDVLWGLTKLLYSDHARSVEAAASVRQDLDIAETAFAEGKVAEAQAKLEDARKGLPWVASEDGAAELAGTHADLLSMLPD
ncbi:hypothetical protein [Actinokineospora terrae]|uniref:Uncharacterized protein n=1 Tax=Actinokineospora terrae TaxID=155974 RepID=A0A1H9X805_9PSEU|nr:hypothetical protein [Actinokineospora terrae]SES42338.1 hypothetical protein SAMN04487818_113127 [Actinokineospora terrae]